MYLKLKGFSYGGEHLIVYLFTPQIHHWLHQFWSFKFDILLCFYRDRRFPNTFKSNENETSNDDFHSDKRKLCTTTIKNEPMKM